MTRLREFVADRPYACARKSLPSRFTPPPVFAQPLARDWECRVTRARATNARPPAIADQIPVQFIGVWRSISQLFVMGGTRVQVSNGTGGPWGLPRRRTYPGIVRFAPPVAVRTSPFPPPEPHAANLR